MMAQYFTGKSNKLGIRSEDPVRRKLWFKDCLTQMERRRPKFKQLAFPKDIGCGLAAGDWPTYKSMIMTLADRNRDIKVDTVK